MTAQEHIQITNAGTNTSEKELEAYHISCVMHNTRVSQRMIDYKVKRGEPEYLNIEEEHKLIEIIVSIIKQDKLKILALNLCADHLHFLIVCNPNNLTKIVGKIKSSSAKVFNVWRGITTLSTRGHAPLYAPSSKPTDRGVTQNSLWAQKFNRKEISDDKYLRGAMEYIENNRVKHGLPELQTDTKKLIQSVLTSYEDVFN